MDKEIVVAKKLKHMNRAEAKVFLISRGYGVPKIREDMIINLLSFAAQWARKLKKSRLKNSSNELNQFHSIFRKYGKNSKKKFVKLFFFGLLCAVFDILHYFWNHIFLEEFNHFFHFFSKSYQVDSKCVGHPKIRFLGELNQSQK